ncbi:LysR family transcriptional regulator [Rhodoferax aquaticus]|uniref:LysR family transcriptional regulator n=2 Tax=Rhodoferax aquaticus TaxID=2527691 RepID=A0A515EV31_9BURK|nr:LysR family transcriptional regulator [Rhodoferax aquaticus]
MLLPRVPSMKLLIGFEAAARLGNFSRAADELALSQSAISHQIQLLEAQLGQPVFRRIGRGVELTVAGKILLSSVQGAINTLRNGMGRINSYQDEGLVVLVCPAPLMHGWLQARMVRLMADLPGLCPLLSTDVTARYVDEIDVDISISERPLAQSGLKESPLMTDSWVMVASTALLPSLEGVAVDQHHAHVGLVCMEDAFTGQATADVFREHLHRFRKRVIYDDERLLLDAAQRGLGLAFLPRSLAQEAMDEGRLHALDGYPVVPGKTWWISRRADEPRSERITQMHDWLLREGQAAS